MAPSFRFPPIMPLIARDPIFNSTMTVDQLRSQWILPGDVFSVLLILGGDVVARALAQLAGSGLTPVAFSFGWVSYSISALVFTVGENKLMPQSPDTQCKVIHGKSGYSRDNTSWILARLVRDFEHWRDPKTNSKTNELIDWKDPKGKSGPEVGRLRRAGLVVSIYKPSADLPAGVPVRDWVYWSGMVTIVVQLGIAAIPYGLFGDWGIMMVTAIGSLLALATGALPQWKKEKWACRRESTCSYILTRGNGAQHAIVVLGNNGRGLNLEDLAAGQSNVEASANNLTRVALFALATMWILLLIAAAGMKENTWFLLAVGAVGIVQNVFVAGWPRNPKYFGVPLDFHEVIGEKKVMDTLFAVEAKYPHIGRAMLSEFFPGKLDPDEVKAWDVCEAKAEAKDKKDREVKVEEKDWTHREAKAEGGEKRSSRP